MSKAKLGLPLEYQKLPEFFEAWNTSETSDAKNAVIEKLLKAQKVKTVLDVTCGTGSQVFYLHERGYECTGSDFSPDLLKIARVKARKAKANISFIDGDMRTVQVGKFDAVISIFNAVGHLTKNGFEKAMRNAYKNLKPAGVFVFDIFNLESATDEAIANFACSDHEKIDGAQIHSAQCSTVDRANGLLTSYDVYMIQKGAQKPEILTNKFSLQVYTAEELKEMLARNGFEVVGQYDMDGSRFIPNKSTSILTVAKRH